jgi:hypothetical protein
MKGPDVIEWLEVLAADCGLENAGFHIENAAIGPCGVFVNLGGCGPVEAGFGNTFAEAIEGFKK